MNSKQRHEDLYQRDVIAAGKSRFCSGATHIQISRGVERREARSLSLAMFSMIHDGHRPRTKPT